MGTFFGIVLVVVLLTIIVYNVVGLIKDIKAKKAKKNEKQREEQKAEVINEGEGEPCSLYDCYPEVDSNVEKQDK